MPHAALSLAPTKPLPASPFMRDADSGDRRTQEGARRFDGSDLSSGVPFLFFFYPFLMPVSADRQRYVYTMLEGLDTGGG
jgi:hypothetical protein